METVLTRNTLSAGSSASMNSIFGLACLVSIASLTTAQTRIKCFNHNGGKDKDRSGILLDCSNMGDNSNEKMIEDWIKYPAFFDEETFLYKRVRSIDLENSNLSSIFEFPGMQSLENLSFKFNVVSSIAKKAFASLPALEELDLSFNSIQSHNLRLNVFRDPDKRKTAIDFSNDEAALKTLKLGYNKIHSLPPFLFEYLKNLERLELNNNPMVVIDQNTQIALGYLKKLQYLDLGYTGISKIPADPFSRLSNVQTLYLNGNNFHAIPPEIRAMPLAFLNMNANPIRRLDGESFSGLDQLQELVICGMPRLIGIGSGTFAPLKKLVTLHLSQNPSLADVQYDAFGEGTTDQWPLRQLYLSNTNLSSLDSNLYPWTKLVLFEARSNRWTCDCRLTWLASYINETFSKMPETLLYYRCHEPEDLSGTLVSQLTANIVCDEESLQVHANHSHGHVTRLRHFVIVIGLVIVILVVGTLINMCTREILKMLKPRAYVLSPFSTGIKYRPADFEENADASETPSKITASPRRSPIVINNTSQKVNVDTVSCDA